MLRAPLAFLTELLAAIPSVIYGLWAVFVLVPLLREHVNPWLIKGFGWTGFFADDNPTGLGFLAAGVILAIMILPDHLLADARGDDGGAALAARGGAGAGRDALGDDPHGRAAECAHRHRGRDHSGLGRALGETMAVAMVIGNSPEIQRSLLANGSTMAAVIANEFAEASSDLHLSALMELGLALFIVTIIVNAFARMLVWTVTRGDAVVRCIKKQRLGNRDKRGRQAS